MALMGFAFNWKWISNSPLLYGRAGTSPEIIVTLEGDLGLSPERKAKLDKELDEIDNAVQYALFTAIDGYYPFYSYVSRQI